MPNAAEIIKDPEFYNLPIEERLKVMKKVDNNFSTLDEEEQVKAINELSNNYMSESQVEIPQEETGINWKGVASGIYRPLLEAGGAVAGGVVGAGSTAPTGPGAILGGVAGGTLGYGMGKKTADTIDELIGIREPLPLKDLAKETVEDLATGATYEMGGQMAGQALVPIFKGGKWIFKKARDMLAGAGIGAGGGAATGYAVGDGDTAMKGAAIGGLAGAAGLRPGMFEKAAGKILKANTSAGTIYAKNAAEAKALQEQIPGLKFTLGQSTNDPGLIKLERSQIRGSQGAANISEEMKAANNEALKSYYEKNFPGEENVDDLVGFFNKQKQGIQGQVDTTKMGAQSQLDELTPALPEKTGQDIVENLQTQKGVVKSQATDLYNQVPAMDVPIDDMLKQFDDIIKPMSRFEDPGNVPEILKKVQNEYTGKDITKSMSLDDLQGLKSEILAQSRQAKSSAIPNERLSSRLSRAADAIDQSIASAEGSEGAGAALRKANQFFRKDYAQVFKQGTVGDILQRGSRGESTKIPLSQIPGKVFNIRNTSAIDDLVKAIGPEESKSLMRDHAAYDLMQSATDLEGNLVSSKFNTWLKKNYFLLEKIGIQDDFMKIESAQAAANAAQDAMVSFERSAAARVLNADPERAIANSIKGNNTGEAATELKKMVKGDEAATKGLQRAFSDHIMDSVETTAKDIADNPTISNAAFNRIMKKYKPAMRVLYRSEPQKLKALETMQRVYEITARNTRSPIGGGSDTAENILTQVSKVNMLSRPVSVAKGIFRFLKKYSDSQIDEFVNRALFDPEYADTLIKASSKNAKPAEMQKIIDDKIVYLDDIKRQRWGQVATGTAVAGRQGD